MGYAQTRVYLREEPPKNLGSKGKGNNVGSRLNVNPNGMFYTKGKSNGSFDENDEIVTKKELNALLLRIAELESRLNP